MVETPTREPEARTDILEFEVGHLIENFLWGEAARKEIENVAHPYPHAANARTPSALLGIRRYALRQLGHHTPPSGILSLSPGKTHSLPNLAWKKRRYFGSYVIFKPRTSPLLSHTSTMDSTVTSQWACVYTRRGKVRRTSSSLG